MNQIKGKPLPNSSPDIIGGITLDDVDLFYPSGPMSKVWLMWKVVRQFATLLDDAHAKRILGLEAVLKKMDTNEPMPEEDIYHLAEVTDLCSQAKLSSSVLVKAAVLHLLASSDNLVGNRVKIEPATEEENPDAKVLEASEASGGMFEALDLGVKAFAHRVGDRVSEISQ